MAIIIELLMKINEIENMIKGINLHKVLEYSINTDLLLYILLKLQWFTTENFLDQLRKRKLDNCSSVQLVGV